MTPTTCEWCKMYVPSSFVLSKAHLSGSTSSAGLCLQIEDTQQNHVGWLFGRGGEGTIEAEWFRDCCCKAGRPLADCSREELRSIVTCTLYLLTQVNKGSLEPLLECTAAFDKGDLLYLRDEEEKKRFLEKDQRESERSQFLAMRAREQAERDASLLDAPRPAKEKGGVRQARLVELRLTPAIAKCSQSFRYREAVKNGDDLTGMHVCEQGKACTYAYQSPARQTSAEAFCSAE